MHSTPAPLIGILADDLDARIERAVTRALQHTQPRRDGRNAETSRPSKEWLTNREALAYLGISKPTLYRYRASGQVRYSKLGSNVFYRKDDLDALLSAGARGASVPGTSSSAADATSGMSVTEQGAQRGATVDNDGSPGKETAKNSAAVTRCADPTPTAPRRQARRGLSL